MLTRSNTYRTIFADAGHTVEWRVTVNGTVYGQDKLIFDAGGGDSRPKLGRALLTGSAPEVGKCVAATFSCAILEESAAIPRMASVVPAYRLALGASASEWITLGTFYIDTRQTDKATGALQLTCYDRMLVADGAGGATYTQLTGFTTWPQPMSSVVAEICTIMGISLDSRTVIKTGTGYQVEYPNDLSMREVLGYIGAAHGGNWTVTAANALRLVPLPGGSDTLNVGAAASGLRVAPALAAWSGVTVYWGYEEAFEAGNDSGRRLTCDCPWATQATADGILATLSGSAYQPYSAQGAIIDLALELGDVVTVGLPGETVTGPVLSIDITASALEQADIDAPGEDEIDHEYPYSSYVDRSLRRKVTLGQSYYGTTISRDKGLFIARSDGKSDVTLNSDRMVFRGLVDGVMRDQIYFDPASGRYIFDGALGADAVFTDSLYAEQGDIAELTVDRLSTSRRIRKYILGDTSDDNYIAIQDNYIKFITGAPVSNAILLTQTGDYIITEDELFLTLETSDYVTTQATNRYGELLYWQREPVGHTEDGYPTDTDGKQIYATTDETAWPVTMYLYKELIKMQEAFELAEGVYQPQVILGAGDENGNSKGYIYKAQQNLLMRYVSSSGKNVDITWSDDGFVDAMHRRLSSCDIDPELGTVTYFVEGDELGHQLTFTVDGDTVTYTWPDGFECTVTIPEDVVNE